jgi:hypothetical protein
MASGRLQCSLTDCWMKPKRPIPRLDWETVRDRALAVHVIDSESIRGRHN